MKIVCAESVLLGREAFGTLGEVVRLPDDRMTRENLRQATALIVRSRTHVDESLLRGTPVAFVGTATAGFDHLDTAFLDSAGIAWAAAPGCNANSVSEYVVAALLCLAHRCGIELAGRTIGVIGVGQVGSRVAAKAEGLGLRVLRNDPPLQLATGEPAYLPLDRMLQEADVVSLHVPLTREGPFATFHLANCVFFSRMRPGGLFINTARGEVTDPDALLLALESGAVRRAVLDVWENEPAISEALLNRVELATPHIAGYSFDGRLNGTQAVYRAACRFFEAPVSWTPVPDSLPPGGTREVDARGQSDEEVLHQLVRSVYDLEADDRALRGDTDGWSAPTETRAERFTRLRATYPERREFSAFTVTLLNGSPELARKIRALGFQMRP